MVGAATRTSPTGWLAARPSDSELVDSEWTANCNDTVEGIGAKMPLVTLVIVLIVVGLVLGLINRYIPMAGSIKTILNVVVVIAVLVWVLQATGLWGPVANFRVSR
jgi:hypothetical protein